MTARTFPAKGRGLPVHQPQPCRPSLAETPPQPWIVRLRRIFVRWWQIDPTVQEERRLRDGHVLADLRGWLIR